MGRIAVLDACTLFPGLLRHVLIQLAVDGLYAPRWSDEINAEWSRALLRRRPALSASSIARTIQLMNEALPGAKVTVQSSFKNRRSCRDPKDDHVLHVAYETRALCIVTFNVRDFPSVSHDAQQPRVITPDQWLCSIWAQAPMQAQSSAQRVMRRLQRPPMALGAFCDQLALEGAANASRLIHALGDHPSH